MLAVRTFSALTAAALLLGGCAAAGARPEEARPRFVAAQTSAPTTPPARAVQPVAPSPTKPSSAPKPAKPPKKSLQPSPRAVTYKFPVDASNVDFHPTHSQYPATDIFADCGEPVVATTSGVVLEVSLKDAYRKGAPDGPLNGGLSVAILGDDGVRYYGSHLSRVQSGISRGVRVAAGQQLGAVGRTGNANNVCHLHFGISPPCRKTGDWDIRRGVVWPAPYLSSWRKKGGKSPVAAVQAWEQKNHCEA